MYVIMAYDIGVERLPKVLKIARRYLTRVQNSVFEGEITEAKFEKLKIEIKEVIDKGKDSVVFYILKAKLYSSREILGVEKGKEEIIL